MKNVNKANKFVVLLFLCITAGCRASYDASWWQQLVPSRQTFEGVAGFAPLLVAAQRALASANKLPSYAYFVPGAIATAVGTVARSDQGWGQALCASAWNQTPSFIFAAALMAYEGWSKKNIQEANVKKFDELDKLAKAYQTKKIRFLNLLEDYFVASSDSSRTVVDLDTNELKQLYNDLVSRYQKISVMNNDLFNQWNQGFLSVSQKESQALFNDVLNMTYLTPAEEVYASLAAHRIFLLIDKLDSNYDDLKAYYNIAYAMADKQVIKDAIIRWVDTYLNVNIETLKGWGLSDFNESVDVPRFKAKLNNNDNVIENIFNRIKRYYGSFVTHDYNEALAKFVDLFDGAMQESGVSFTSPLINQSKLANLKDVYNKVLDIYNGLLNSEYGGSGGNEIIQETMLLTPAEVLCAHYLAYMYVYSKEKPQEILFDQMPEIEKQDLVISIATKNKRQLQQLIAELKAAGFNGFNNGTFVDNFVDLLEDTILFEGLQEQPDKANFLLKHMFMLIKEYSKAYQKHELEMQEQFEAEIAPPVRPLTSNAIELEEERLTQLRNEYQKLVTNFVAILLTNDALDVNQIQIYDEQILPYYISLQESIAWLQKYNHQVSFNLLPPLDEIYANVAAHFIKPHLQHVKVLGRDNFQEILNMLRVKQNNIIKNDIDRVIFKFPTLKAEVDAMHEQENNDRYINLIIKIIDIINQLRKHEEALLTSELQDILDV